MSNLKSKPALPFSVSAIFFIIYLVFGIVPVFLFKWNFVDYILNIDVLLFFVPVLLLIIFIFTKSLFLVQAICILPMLYYYSYSLIGRLSIVNFERIELYDILSVLPLIFYVITFLMLFLLALGCSTKRNFKGISYAWFVPLILSIFALCFTLLNTVQTLSTFDLSFIEYMEESDQISYAVQYFGSLVFDFLSKIFLTVAICLLAKWYGKIAKIQSAFIRSTSF